VRVAIRTPVISQCHSLNQKTRPLEWLALNKLEYLMSIRLSIATLCIIPCVALATPVKTTDNSGPNQKKTNNETPFVYHGSWKGTNVGAGGVFNTGNTRSSSINAQDNIKYVYKKWELTQQSTFLRDESRKSGLTAQRLYLQGQAQYNLHDKNFVYSQVNYTDDRFDGYSYTGNWNVGYGRNIIDKKNMTLSTFMGPGIQRTVPEDTGKIHDLPNLQVGSKFNYKLNPEVDFNQSIQGSATHENVRTTLTTALTTKLIDNLSFQISFQAINDTDPQPGKNSWNTITSFNLLYNFA